MLETLISSKMRIKLLLKFFLNSNATSYLRGLEAEFGDSTNAIRVELNRFEKAGMLSTFIQGNKKYFRANTKHPLYSVTHNLLMKYIGFDQIIDTVIDKIGDLKKVYVIGAFAKGLDDNVIELIFVGHINEDYLSQLILKTKNHIHREIKFSVFEEDVPKEMKDYCENSALLLWES